MWLISNRVWTRKICSASTRISIQCKLYSTNLNHWFVLGWEIYALTKLFDTMHERIIRVDISPVVLNNNNTKADVTVWPLKSLQYIPALVLVVSNHVNRPATSDGWYSVNFITTSNVNVPWSSHFGSWKIFTIAVIKLHDRCIHCFVDLHWHIVLLCEYTPQ